MKDLDKFDMIFQAFECEQGSVHIVAAHKYSGTSE